MNWIIPIEHIAAKDRPRVGGKGFALYRLFHQGFTIPDTVCITVEAYEEFISKTGLKERILIELHRKDFKDMRWEEIWDTSLRIRNLFVNKTFPKGLAEDLRSFFPTRFADTAVVVRSSAPDEDTAQSSFAGLHDSFLNIRGVDAILDNIRKVWASLWSDAALLYRQELGLDVEKSAMAVVVQEIIAGDRSGVSFTKNPNNEYEGVVESVYGLNEGLVDGTVEPDRWTLDRTSGKITFHTAAVRENYMVAGTDGVQLKKLPEKLVKAAPLDDHEVGHIFKIALRAERFFGKPQDVEWTYRDAVCYLLQSRPITTLSESRPADQRRWYLSLHRSFENLKALRDKIENKFIPQMIKEAESLSLQDLAGITDSALAEEIQRRIGINDKWSNIYWTEFIPFAHGVRLFGQVYNDTVRPDNPYEFMDLLGATPMTSLERNQMLEDLASAIRKDPDLRLRLENRDPIDDYPSFTEKLNRFIDRFGDLSCPVTGGTQCAQGVDALIKVILEIASHPPARLNRSKDNDAESLKQSFLSRFDNEKRKEAYELLNLARTSHQLRDDDNIYLGKIEAQLIAAVEEGRRRLSARRFGSPELLNSEEIKQALMDEHYRPQKRNISEKKVAQDPRIKARQLIGQPAGPGLSKGVARVIMDPAELSDFKYGEVLVCDAVDPNMTFVVPLASAVIERRGGMLIHGAIIAREYGLPCVTGVPDATALIRTGDSLTVDGYLGIVTVE